MKLHASGEDYLETILVLQKKLSMVRAVDVARHHGVEADSHLLGNESHGFKLRIAFAVFNLNNRARTHVQFFSQSTLCYLLLDSLLPKFEGKKVKKVHQKSPLLYFMVSSNSAKYTPNSCQMSYTSQARNM